MSQIFADVVEHAERLSLERCPYRDRNDHCTALFRCRNQRPVENEADVLSCGHDGTFDYRSAWESNPRAEARVKDKIATIKREAELKRRADKNGEWGS